MNYGDRSHTNLQILFVRYMCIKDYKHRDSENFESPW